MNVSESIAVTHLVAWLANPDSDPEGAKVALTELAKRAHACLAAGSDRITEAPAAIDRLVGRLAAADSDGAAQAVCEALARHEAHGGSIPWPTVRQPFADWRVAKEAQQP